jgi:hypothetical protein
MRLHFARPGTPRKVEWSTMSAIVLGAFFALAVLVMALAGSHFARRTLMLMVAMLAIVLLAVWFLS